MEVPPPTPCTPQRRSVIAAAQLPAAGPSSPIAATALERTAYHDPADAESRKRASADHAPAGPNSPESRSPLKKILGWSKAIGDRLTRHGASFEPVVLNRRADGPSPNAVAHPSIHDLSTPRANPSIANSTEGRAAPRAAAATPAIAVRRTIVPRTAARRTPNEPTLPVTNNTPPDVAMTAAVPHSSPPPHAAATAPPSNPPRGRSPLRTHASSRSRSQPARSTLKKSAPKRSASSSAQGKNSVLKNRALCINNEFH